MDSERNAERHYYADNNRTKVQEAGQLKRPAGSFHIILSRNGFRTVEKEAAGSAVSLLPEIPERKAADAFHEGLRVIFIRQL